MASSSLLPRILLGTVILLSGITGYQNLQNKATLDAAREDSKTNQGKYEKASADLAKNTDLLKVAQGEMKAANEKVVEVQKARDEAKAQAQKLTTDLADATALVQTKTTEIAALTKKIEDANPTGGPGVAAPDPALTEKVTVAEARAAKAEQDLKAAVAAKEDAEKKMVALETDAKLRLEKAMRPGLEGKVLAVNGNWNFAVLSIGDKQGVMTGTSLVVKRGNMMVAKLRVTSVEPSTCIADIQPGTLSKGTSIQPGDVVIFPSGS